MMDFIIMTLSLTVAILLAGIISTVVIFTLMGNVKFAKWITSYYLKMMTKYTENLTEEFEKFDKELDAI